jgi:putative endonuclease
MTYYLYIARCNDNSFYTGITWNINKRIDEHNRRTKSCLQKNKVPVKLVYSERFKNRRDAAKREREIKGWSRKKKIKLINSEK